jgi:hypothetical protein
MTGTPGVLVALAAAAGLASPVQHTEAASTPHPQEVPDTSPPLPLVYQRRATRPGHGTPSRRSLRLRGRARGARRARKAARRG